MAVDPANAPELAKIAGEIVADVFKGDSRYPSEASGWQLGELDLCEYLDRYRDQQVVVIIAPVGPAPEPTYTCGACGFVYNERGECSWCNMLSGGALPQTNRVGAILDQVRELLNGFERD